MVTWLFEADIYHDKTFAQDLTAYLISANWSSGFQTQNEYVAPPARLTATLDNTSGAFYPETLGAELLTNGDFSTWSSGLPTGWTSSATLPAAVQQSAPDKGYNGGGTGACNLYSDSAGVSASVAQSVLTSGKTYKVTIRVTRATTGNITVTRAPVIVTAAASYSGVVRLAPEPAGAIKLTAGTRQIGAILSKFGSYTFYVRANGVSFKIETVTIDGKCNITFDDVSVKEVSLLGNLLTPGTLVRMRANGTTLWQGALSAEAGTPIGVRRTSGMVSDQSVTLVAEDYMLKLLDAEFIPGLETNVTTGTVLQGIFDDGILLAPYPANTMRLDVQGSSELDTTNCKLWDAAGLASIETGLTELPFAGDVADSGAGVSAQGYIRDLVSAEAGGRFYWDARAGVFVFKSRDAYVYRGTISQTFTQADLLDAQYFYGDTLHTQYTINYTDRKVGAVKSTLWNAKDVPIRIRADDERAIVARYTTNTDDKTRVGGQDFVVPVSGLDWTATANEDGTGADMTAFVDVLAQFGATAANVRIFNNATSDVYIQTAQLRGTPLVAYNATYSVLSPDAVSAYGTLPKTESLPMLSNTDFVQDYAAWNLSKYATLGGRFASITYHARTPSTNEAIAIALEIGAFVRVTDSAANHDANYVLIGEQHTIDASSGGWNVTYFLLQTNRELSMLLDVSSTNQLDINARLGL